MSLELISTLPVLRSILAFKCTSILSKSSTSVMSGTLLIVAVSSQRIAAGIKATTLFLAPLIVIVPDNLCPPSILILGIGTSLYILCIFAFFVQQYNNILLVKKQALI